jgi:hypothetical protein
LATANRPSRNYSAVFAARKRRAITRITLSAKYGVLLIRNKNCFSLTGTSLASLAANCCRAARRGIDQGHFSENALRQRLEHAITETDFNLAALNNEQFLCRVTLPEDDIVSLEVARGNAGTCQKSKINRRIRHICTPDSECARGGALPLYEDYLLSLGSR